MSGESEKKEEKAKHQTHVSTGVAVFLAVIAVGLGGFLFNIFGQLGTLAERTKTLQEQNSTITEQMARNAKEFEDEMNKNRKLIVSQTEEISRLRAKVLGEITEEHDRVQVAMKAQLDVGQEAIMGQVEGGLRRIRDLAESS